MDNEITYEIESSIAPGVCEYDPIIKTLSFHSAAELYEWKQGQAIRLIIRWIKPAPPPRGK